MRDLYSIGEMVIDFIPGNEPGSYIRNPGGAPANVAIAVSRNHLKAGLCCKVGDDDFGTFLMDTLRENNVKILGGGPCQKAVTTMAFVNLSPSGERSFTFARKPGADMFLSEEDVDQCQIKESVIVHAGSCSLSAEPAAAATRRALKLARENGRLVSFDVNYRNLMWKDDCGACFKSVEEILPCVDFLKISEEEADMIGGVSSIPDLMKKNGIALVVETLGKDGARAWWNGRILSVPGRTARAVDATGAGDAFWGGFLSSLRIQGVEKVSQLSEDGICRALEYGNTAGWLCVQEKGAIGALPSREEIEKIIEEQKGV